jgi:hypothetical protein
VNVRSSESGEEMLVFRDELGRMEAIQWSHDGMKLAAGNWSDQHSLVRIWDASIGYNQVAEE